MPTRGGTSWRSAVNHRHNPYSKLPHAQLSMSHRSDHSDFPLVNPDNTFESTSPQPTPIHYPPYHTHRKDLHHLDGLSHSMCCRSSQGNSPHCSQYPPPRDMSVDLCRAQLFPTPLLWVICARPIHSNHVLESMPGPEQADLGFSKTLDLAGQVACIRWNLHIGYTFRW